LGITTASAAKQLFQTTVSISATIAGQALGFVSLTAGVFAAAENRADLNG
jgi:hypothetical protein